MTELMSTANGHHRGAGEDAELVQFEDGAIDAGGEAEVVGVYDEAGHWVV